MILYSAPPSYYSMIARLALNESQIPVETHYMDIHLAKDQLSPWYIKINPAMTVPTLTGSEHTWTDSRDILKFAANNAADKWCDADPRISTQIEKIVAAHYVLPIEKLTFGKIMVKNPIIRKLFPFMLERIIRQLETESKTVSNPQAAKNKIVVNQERLAYFTQGDLTKKFHDRKEEVHDFLNQLPKADHLLFGEKPGSADIVTAILCARLNMIGEKDLIQASPNVLSWFERMKSRPAFIQSDIWLHFKPWRIFLKY